MKQPIKQLSVFLAMLMAAGTFAGFSAFAQEPQTALPSAAAASESQPEESPTTEPTPVPVVQVKDYQVEILDGTDNLWDRMEGGHVTISFLNAEGVVSGRVVNNACFTNYGPVEAQVQNGSVTFNNILYLGGGNTLQFELVTSNGVVQESIVIAQCLDSADTQEPEATATPEPEKDYPKILVKDFSFGGTSVEAGKEFVLDLTLFTTSGTSSLQDVMVGLNLGDAKNISLASGSMNTYVGTMAPNTTKTISFKMTTDATIEPGAISISVNLSSKEGEAAVSPISIPVTQPERFDITNMEAPEVLMMGEEGYLSVTFVNKGKSSINNLSAEIQGDNLSNPGQSQFLGNIQPGTENSVDFSVIASQEGALNGKVILTYEDAKGEIKSIEKEFSCMVEQGMSMDDMMNPGFTDEIPEEPQQAGIPVWGWALIALGIVGVAAIVVVIVRKKAKAKKLTQLEDEDEDI